MTATSGANVKSDTTTVRGFDSPDCKPPRPAQPAASRQVKNAAERVKCLAHMTAAPPLRCFRRIPARQAAEPPCSRIRAVTREFLFEPLDRSRTPIDPLGHRPPKDATGPDQLIGREQT